MNKTTKEDNVEIAENAKIDRPSFLSLALAFQFIFHHPRPRSSEFDRPKSSVGVQLGPSKPWVGQ